MPPPPPPAAGPDRGLSGARSMGDRGTYGATLTGDMGGLPVVQPPDRSHLGRLPKPSLAAVTAPTTLPQHGAQLAGLPTPGPDHHLMGASQCLDGLGLLTVTSHRPVVATVEAHDLGEHVCVTGIALGARGGVPLAIARDLQRVQGIDPPTRSRPMPEPSHHGQFRSLPAPTPLRRHRRGAHRSGRATALTRLPLRAVVGPAPDPARLAVRRRDVPRPSHHPGTTPASSPFDREQIRPEEARSALMVQCSPHATGHGIPATITPPRAPAGARSRHRPQGPVAASAHPPTDSSTTLAETAAMRPPLVAASIPSP